jgi:hypothetical protein
VDNYTQIVVDANFAPSGPANWSLIESVTVDRNGANLVTATEITSTYPVPIVRSTGSATGNVYVAMVEIKSGGNWRPHQRETIYSDGVLDTASMIETYDTVNSVYVNTDRWSMSYNSSSQIVEGLHYTWSGGAWTLKDKRQFTYSGAEYLSDTTYQLNGSNWEAFKTNDYFYIAGLLDSVVLFEKVGGVFQATDAYSMGKNTANEIDTIYNYVDNGNGLKLSSRIIFLSTPNVVSQIAAPASVMVFPNPARNVITIRTGSTYAGGMLNISDVSGKLVLTAPLRGEEQTLDVSGLAPGNYILRLGENSGLRTARMFAIAR